MTTYQYVGDGMGLPGLPNVVTDDEAKEAGVLDLLENAVQVGVYVEVKEVKPSKVEPKGSKGVSNG